MMSGNLQGCSHIDISGRRCSGPLGNAVQSLDESLPLVDVNSMLSIVACFADVIQHQQSQMFAAIPHALLDVLELSL